MGPPVPTKPASGPSSKYLGSGVRTARVPDQAPSTQCGRQLPELNIPRPSPTNQPEPSEPQSPKSPADAVSQAGQSPLSPREQAQKVREGLVGSLGTPVPRQDRRAATDVGIVAARPSGEPATELPESLSQPTPVQPLDGLERPDPPEALDPAASGVARLAHDLLIGGVEGAVFEVVARAADVVEPGAGAALRTLYVVDQLMSAVQTFLKGEGVWYEVPAVSIGPVNLNVRIRLLTDDSSPVPLLGSNVEWDAVRLPSIPSLAGADVSADRLPAIARQPTSELTLVERGIDIEQLLRNARERVGADGPPATGRPRVLTVSDASAAVGLIVMDCGPSPYCPAVYMIQRGRDSTGAVRAAGLTARGRALRRCPNCGAQVDGGCHFCER